MEEPDSNLRTGIFTLVRNLISELSRNAQRSDKAGCVSGRQNKSGKSLAQGSNVTEDEKYEERARALLNIEK